MTDRQELRGGALQRGVRRRRAGLFAQRVDEARRENTRVRLRIRLADPVLADLPWEFLYNPAVNRFLALSVQTPLVSYMELPEVISRSRSRRPSACW